MARVLEKARAFPALFPAALDADTLSERDRRLAETIDRQVTMRWSTLRAFIEPHLKAAWDDQHPALITALMCGAAQMLLMDRIPDHAAIGQSVEWCKSTPMRKASGVVNAVLRKIAATRQERIEQADVNRDDHLLHADGSGWLLSRQVFAGSRVQRLARQTGCPRTLIERWTQQYDEDTARHLALHALAQPPVCVQRGGNHEALEPHALAPCHVLTRGGRLSDVLQAFPEAFVQAPTSAAAVLATADLNPRCIIDWCAGRGTKTRHLTRLHGEARVLASDASASRREQIAALSRMDERIELLEPTQVEAHVGTADLLVLDVPCTNSGVLSRRPEARHRQDNATRSQLVTLQRQIVADSLALLAPHGHVLWTTCSIDPDENEQQLAWLEKWHGLTPVMTRLELGRGGPGEDARHWIDGGFHALLHRA